MYNGNHHNEEAGKVATPKPEVKEEKKPAAVQRPEVGDKPMLKK